MSHNEGIGFLTNVLRYVKVTRSYMQARALVTEATYVCVQLLCINNIIIIYLFTAIGLLPGGSGYFTCKQNMKLATTKFKSGGLHEQHVVATWNLGNHLSISL